MRKHNELVYLSSYLMDATLSQLFLQVEYLISITALQNKPCTSKISSLFVDNINSYSLVYYYLTTKCIGISRSSWSNCFPLFVQETHEFLSTNLLVYTVPEDGQFELHVLRAKLM
jgi:hypothetical protein